MEAQTEYTIEFRPCPRCLVDLDHKATVCDFCGLNLGPPVPQMVGPAIARVKKRGRVVAERREWKAF